MNANTNNPYVVGITGGSGSGKTTFVHKLISCFDAKEICLISQDHYYRPFEQQPKDTKGIENYDLPDSINVEEFVSDVQQVYSGKIVKKKEYNYNNPLVDNKEIVFNPAKIILLEGLFLYESTVLNSLYDFKIFIDTDKKEREKRRIQRDSTERGNSLEEILFRLKHHVEPAYIQHIEKHKYTSDIIIPNHQNFDKAVDVIFSYLQRLVD